jgi:phosphoribosylformylglycinamidine synthase
MGPAATATSSGRPRTRAIHRVEVALRPDLGDPAGREARRALIDAGLTRVDDVRVLRIYFLLADGGARANPIPVPELERAAKEVLADPVLDRFAVDRALQLDAEDRPETTFVSVSRNAGVTDPEAESARVALRAIGIPVAAVKTARVYAVRSDAAADDVLVAVRRALGNDVIEEVKAGRVSAYGFPTPTARPIRRRTIKVRTMDGESLEALSRDMGLSLNRVEMETIRDHFRALRREPTDVELETLAQTWSEHCKHKTLAGAVRMQDARGQRVFKNLLKETVFEATRRLDRSWCWSVFEDNAGVIDFDGKDGVCFKVETHNHPSAIEPYGGAGTGIGGVIRDILGTGLGARPVANTDVFCFGDPELAFDDVPKGAMHPLRLLRGVAARRSRASSCTRRARRSRPEPSRSGTPSRRRRSSTSCSRQGTAGSSRRSRTAERAASRVRLARWANTSVRSSTCRRRP